MVDDIFVILEDAVGEKIVSHELPEVLDRIKLGGFGGERQQGQVGRGL